MASISIQPTFKEILEHWVSLIDIGEYQKSWAVAASYFRENVTESDWIQAVTQVRQVLGIPTARTITTATHTQTLANMPIAEYLVVQYQSMFPMQRMVTETITLMHEELGWRVAGYYVG